LLEETRVLRNVTIAAGGTVVPFPKRFHLTPAVRIEPLGATPRIGVHINDSTVQTTALIYSLAGADVGGPADIYATGV
jgi:hypothetical protein